MFSDLKTGSALAARSIPAVLIIYFHSIINQ